MIPELEKAVESMKKNERSIFDINSLKFDIKLIDFYKIEHKNYWDYDNERERLINANLLKTKGNDYLKEKKFNEATNSYLSGSLLINEDNGISFDDLKQNLNQNLILAYLKTNDFIKAKEIADQLLKENNKLIKVLFRRSLAFIGLGDFENAKNDLNNALIIDPNNIDILNELNSLKEKEKNFKNKEKAVFGKMFGNK